MFEVGNFIMNTMNMNHGVEKIFLVVKEYPSKSGIKFYDIINIKNKLRYIRIPLPEDFYVKLERIF